MFEIKLKDKTGTPMKFKSDIMSKPGSEEHIHMFELFKKEPKIDPVTRKAELNAKGKVIMVDADNELTRWLRAKSELFKKIDSLGFAIPEMPGFRQVPRDLIEKAMDVMEEEIKNVNRYRDTFVNVAPTFLNKIRLEHAGKPCLPEVEHNIENWDIDTSKMTPTMIIRDLAEGTGLVPSERVQQAILNSKLEMKKEFIESIEKEIGEMFKRCDTPGKVKTQLGAMEELLNKLGPMIKDYSSDPDLIKKVSEGMKILEQLPDTAEELKAEDAQEKVKQGLDLFGIPHKNPVVQAQAQAPASSVTAPSNTVKTEEVDADEYEDDEPADDSPMLVPDTPVSDELVLPSNAIEAHFNENDEYVKDEDEPMVDPPRGSEERQDLMNRAGEMDDDEYDDEGNSTDPDQRESDRIDAELDADIAEHEAEDEYEDDDNSPWG